MGGVDRASPRFICDGSRVSNERSDLDDRASEYRNANSYAHGSTYLYTSTHRYQHSCAHYHSRPANRHAQTADA